MLELKNWRINSMTKEISSGDVDLHRIRMKDNIGDTIAEYLDDDNYSPLTFYNDLIDELKTWQDYHKKKLEKVSAMIQLFTGNSQHITGDFSYPDRSIIQFNTNINYTEEELNSMCDKAASDQEKQQCREYNLREAEYYNQRSRLDIASTKKDWDDFWEHK